MAPFDINDQATLTNVIVRPLVTQYEDGPFLGKSIMPERRIPGRYAKLQVRQALAFGRGQFRALNASPLLYKGLPRWEQATIELALPDEMERIDEEMFMRLKSGDENILRSAGLDLVERGQILAKRNMRAVEWMRWQAITGELVIPYGSSQEAYINYGIPAANKPTVAVLWSDPVNSDPVADMLTFSNQLGKSCGWFGNEFVMTSTTFSNVQKNQKLRALLTATDRSMLIPNENDIKALLRPGANITLYDNGWRDTAVGSARGIPDSLTQYLPDGYVAVFPTGFMVEGEPVAETLVGDVLLSNGFDDLKPVPGPAAEVIVSHIVKEYMLRYANSAIPRINQPEAVLYAKVL